MNHGECVVNNTNNPVDSETLCVDKDVCPDNYYSNKDDYTCVKFADCIATEEGEDRMFVNFNQKTCVKESYCKDATKDNQYVNYIGSTCLDQVQCYAIDQYVNVDNVNKTCLSAAEC